MISNTANVHTARKAPDARVLLPAGRWRLAQQLPKGARRQNSNRCVGSDDEQILIACHEDVRLTRDRRCYNPPIARIADTQLARRCWLGDDRKRSEDCLDRIDTIGRYLELRRQHTPKLSQDHFADDQFMLGQDSPKHVGAQTARGERRYENISVEADPHETALNTSSSVR